MESGALSVDLVTNIGAAGRTAATEWGLDENGLDVRPGGGICDDDAYPDLVSCE